MHSWIVRVKDVQVDGNCGYRAVASLLDFGEAGWSQVRHDLLGELNAYPYLYEVYMEVISAWRRYSLSHFDGTTSYKWMIMPEMRFLISSHYKVILFF